MRLVADQNVERPVVVLLREAGHDLLYIAESAPGIPDTEVLRLADQEARLLITNDKDFAELAFLQRKTETGILLVRMPLARSLQKAERIIELLEDQGPVLFEALTVVTADAARRRPLPR